MGGLAQSQSGGTTENPTPQNLQMIYKPAIKLAEPKVRRSDHTVMKNARLRDSRKGETRRRLKPTAD